MPARLPPTNVRTSEVRPMTAEKIPTAAGSFPGLATARMYAKAAPNTAPRPTPAMARPRR